jgi:hypothetical protein
MKPICFPCHRYFKMVKSGFYFIEGMPFSGARVQPGLSEPEKWKPYKLWSGDVWECPGCKAKIISGTGLQPVDEHYKETFKENVKVTNGDQYQCNDC